jgi:hypothetical protein
MAITTRQTAIFGVEDWKQIYQTYREADFQSYDFETLRKSFVDYLRLYYPETFNDYIESSEFIALLDVMAFMGQALAFRSDLNARENYLDTAERRDSVTRLANLVSYTSKRNIEAQGTVKVIAVSTTENITDYTGANLSNITINWNDPTNPNWLEQFTSVINAALVDSQRVGRPGNSQFILGVKNDEYAVNLVPGFIPVIPYTTVVDGISMPFELVSATAKGSSQLYEPAPRPDSPFNIVYKNDQLGFGSPNTGYFFLFKQGVLQNQDFNLAERVTNRTVNINIEGINNDDRWLFQLDNVGTVTTEWEYVQNIYTAAAEQISTAPRSIYSTQSRVNDQITLTFGDGVFSAIPVGNFRAYVRASNGLTYIINPEEMSNVTASISYVSRTGRTEVITFTCSLQTPVSNAQSRESIAEIKQRAPARYYTQNRMVNGEDYNLFPYTEFSSIIKSKAVARSAIGTSRYLELIDATGKYSSTNVFASDGALFTNLTLPTVIFSWFTINDIADVITNVVQPLLNQVGTLQFYYANYTRPQLIGLDTTWNQSTTVVNETTGYFVAPTGLPAPIGPFNSSNLRFIVPQSLIKFVPPTGYHFDVDNRLVLGASTLDTDKTYIWASPLAVELDGTGLGEGNNPDGTGPVVLDTFVPTDAVLSEVIPIFITDLPSTIETEMREQIRVYRNFGLGYNNLTATWYLITSTNLAQDAAFSLTNAQNTAGQNLDASWIMQFITNGLQYTLTTRQLTYNFGSVIQTRFFYRYGSAIFDPRTGTTIKDYIKVLKSNSQANNNQPLPGDIAMQIVGQPVQSDGEVDDFQVLVSFEDNDQNGTPDDPDFFSAIVPAGSYVFLQKTVDFDGLERYLLINSGVVNYNYATLAQIDLVKAQYIPGQVFYATSDVVFYQLELDAITLQRTLVEVTEGDYVAKPGRQDLYFQYRANSPLSSRIDPATSNIIDVYVVTQSYYTAYQNWIKDTTNTVAYPEPPTIDELNTQYQGLQNFKMISDQLILNSVVFKPLFGSKAASNLRAIIKVVRAAKSTASDSEIKDLVISALNNYFTIDKWNFGDTFYFSELSAYIHSEIGTVVSSVVLVPLNPQKSFGDLYEIRSAPDEIFVNGATVADIEIIAALTSTNLQTAPGSGVI